MRAWTKHGLLLLALTGLLLPAAAFANDDSATLYRLRPVGKAVPIWRDGAGGPISQFQRALRDALIAEKVAEKELPGVDGSFGPGTQRALARLLKTPRFADLQPAGGDVRITADLWHRLMPGVPVPSVDQRIETLVLTYEATPYEGEAQWNFCQNSLSSKRRSNLRCLSNDPTSYLTWGPRGATAGGGHEIQGILIAVDAQAPDLIDRAFAEEAGPVRRFLELEEKRRAPVTLDMEIYLCGIWMDAGRAAKWSNGFARLGAEPLVRSTYIDLYRSVGFDGAKMKAFFKLYTSLGRTPTEVDLAFFTDRATHTGGVFAKDKDLNSGDAIAAVALAVRQMLGGVETAEPWEVRRALSRILATANQQVDRNGRDVVFFVDGAGEAGLTTDERENWSIRGPRKASDAGLRDDQVAEWAGPTQRAFSTRKPGVAALTNSERQVCPLWVLNWTNPNPKNGPRQPAIARRDLVPVLGEGRP